MFVHMRSSVYRVAALVISNERSSISKKFAINRTFRTSSPAFIVRGTRFHSTATDLGNRLNEELKYELESDHNKKEKDEAIEFLKNNSWKVDDVEGEKYVTFTKNQGNNRITIVLDADSIGDDTGNEYLDDEYEDENQRENDEEVDERDDLDNIERVNATVVIENTKNSEKTGVLKVNVDMTQKDFSIKQVEHHIDAKSALDYTYNPLINVKSYTGPQYHTLDSEIQKLYENYFAELKLDSRLAKFLYSYSLCKEFNEYTRWLKHTSKFFAE